MTHREKVDAFVADIAKRGVSEKMSAPPVWRLLWALGLKIPPPHFMSYWPLALIFGLMFGIPWGAAMYFLLWSSQGWRFSASAGAFAGLLFGLIGAAFFRYAAKKLSLPTWEDYSPR